MPLTDEAADYLSGPNAPAAFPADADPIAAAAYLARARARKPIVPVSSALLVSDVRLDAGPAVRVYRAPELQIRPVIAFLHGGGWVMGGLDGHDALCRTLSAQSGCVVVNVDYRLAPEHPFPAAVHDALAVIEWIGTSIGEYSGDAGRLVAMGSSAGGSIAAAAALATRDRPTPPIGLQVLVYPALDSSMSGASHRENAPGHGLGSVQMRWFWEQYVPDARERSNPLASPVHADAFAGLPPAMIVTAQYDILRDDGTRYAEQLREAGVEVQLCDYPGEIHGFLNIPSIPDSGRAMTQISTAIRRWSADHPVDPRG